MTASKSPDGDLENCSKEKTSMEPVRVLVTEIFAGQWPTSRPRLLALAEYSQDSELYRNKLDMTVKWVIFCLLGARVILRYSETIMRCKTDKSNKKWRFSQKKAPLFEQNFSQKRQR
jgi:hypothetical protein